jgi:general secretion pathway protein C
MNAASWLEGLPAHDRWRTLLLKEGPRIATWVLAVAVAAQAALIVTDLAGAGRQRPVPASHAPVQSHTLDVAAITNAHFFGVATEPSGPPKQTDIPLVLTGTIAGSDPQNGLAILGQTAQTARVYAVGDNIPGGVKLHSVYSDHVLIDRNGQLESLNLPRQLNSGNAPPPTTAALQGDNASIERMRRMITEQPGLLADVLRPQPVMDHGRMNGFRVYPGRNRMAFMRLGLRPGDQVTAINGTPLDDRDRGEQILHTLSSSTEARVTVIRNGQQQDLNLNIAQVEQEADSLAAQSQATQSGVPPASPDQPPTPGGSAPGGVGSGTQQPLPWAQQPPTSPPGGGDAGRQ